MKYQISKGKMPVKDVKYIVNEIEKIKEEWLEEENINIDVKINGRLKSNNGVVKFIVGEYKNFHIDISYKLWEFFGMDAVLGTLRHEFAHVINMVMNGDGGRGHGKNFKEICRALGGHMNKKHAGEEYTDCLTDSYVSCKPKWTLICPTCGYSLSRNRLTKNFQYHYMCQCGTMISKFRKFKNY